ncbi:hypothetical protein [Pseudalkalibacillus caeni]|uniref:Uncharacterized protein n=1 Tax=Exobacillus caeni TaxID=2574798 RepID=A0A5R9F0R8_9BACL|nr:hypothetical protein [Pseudalkalibacillus caeni]TLS36591.1 hypothetical protein FCL54_13780 [Pseudalkalibacillus caeni]
MSKFKNKHLLKAIGLPLILSAVLIGLLIFQNLQNEIQLPDEGWSRSIPLPITTGETDPFVRSDEDGFSVYAPESGKIVHLKLDKALNVKNESSIPAGIGIDDAYWAKDNEAIYIKDGTLLSLKGNEETTILDNVTGLSASESTIVAWKENKLFTVNTETKAATPAGETKDPISSVVIPENAPSFIVISNPKETVKKLSYYKAEAGNSYTATDMFTLEMNPGENIFSIDYIENKAGLEVVYNTFAIRQGKREYRALHTSIPFENLSSEPSFKAVNLFEEKAGSKLQDPAYLQFALKGQKPTLFFAARGASIQKKDSVNIYEAIQKDDKWLANRRSTSEQQSVLPVFGDDQTLFWMDHENGRYSLATASSNPDVIEKSQKLTGEDWKNASADTFQALMGALMVIFNSMMWIIPTAIFLFAMLVVNVNAIENDERWVRTTSIVLYLLTQIALIHFIFNNPFYTFAPSYLTFTGSVVILPLLLGVLTWLFNKFGRNDEWGSISKVSYFIALNTWIVLIVIGPYIL